MTYQLITAGGVLDTSTNTAIAPDRSSAAWNAYRTWLKQGNTPLPADPPPPPPAPTQAELDAQALLAQDATDTATAKGNAVIRYLVSHTPAQCQAKVLADVVDLASAKQMLGNFAVALSVLARHKLR